MEVSDEQILSFRQELHRRGMPGDDWLDEDVIQYIELLSNPDTVYKVWVEFVMGLWSRELVPANVMQNNLKYPPQDTVIAYNRRGYIPIYPATRFA